MTPSQSLRLVVIAPDSLCPDASDVDEIAQAERSRMLRITLLENGYNIVAVLPSVTPSPTRTPTSPGARVRRSSR